MGQDGGDSQVLSLGLSVQGFAQWRLGRLDDAIVSLRESLKIAQTVHDNRTCLRAGSELAQCYLRQGMFDRALTLVEQMEALWSEHNVRENPALSLPNALAEVYLLAAERARNETSTAEGTEPAEESKSSA